MPGPAGPWVRVPRPALKNTAYRMAFFFMHIFPSRLRTFSEAPALFTMYKSEGPISKTNKPPRSNGLKQRRRAGVAEIAGEKGEEGRRRQHLPVNDGRCHRASTHSPAILGPVTHVCPPTPQVSCRAQADLFRGSGRSRTFFRTISTTNRGVVGMRNTGSNRHPCSCHALRHPTGRHPSLTHPTWVPHA